jgi:hypothetical protein
MQRRIEVWLAPLAIAALLSGAGAPAWAQSPDAGAAPAPERWHVAIEAAANVRDSQDLKFALHAPYPGSSGAPAFQQTVDPGTHAEVSSVSLAVDYRPSSLLRAHLRFDGVDLYYRNPTTTDHPYDLAELWLLWGRETPVAVLPATPGAYVRIGKFRRAEAQADRHLESYGLATTAFERWEDAGIEAGGDLGSHLFGKIAVTEGNPLFVRDPNALAGDTPLLLTNYTQAERNSGIVVLYDTHVESLDFAHPEYAAYLGTRFGDPSGDNGMELMLWGRRRTLADSIDLPGSPLGGDLAALAGPGGVPLVPFSGNGKHELGANLWLYHGGLSLFAQWVVQRVAGLGRTGVEAEAAWRIDLPLRFAVRGRQLFSAITPVLRYSRLHDDFPNLQPTPEPSLDWDWDKYDAGLRLGIWGGIDLTVELAWNRIDLTPQLVSNESEGLATLRLRW